MTTAGRCSRRQKTPSPAPEDTVGSTNARRAAACRGRHGERRARGWWPLTGLGAGTLRGGRVRQPSVPRWSSGSGGVSSGQRFQFTKATGNIDTGRTLCRWPKCGWSPRLRTARNSARLTRNALDEVVLDGLGDAQTVRVGGLVQLAVRVTPAQKKRKGRNPATGEELDIAAKPASVDLRARPLAKAKSALPSVQKARRRLSALNCRTTTSSIGDRATRLVPGSAWRGAEGHTAGAAGDGRTASG